MAKSTYTLSIDHSVLSSREHNYMPKVVPNKKKNIRQEEQDTFVRKKKTYTVTRLTKREQQRLARQTLKYLHDSNSAKRVLNK